MKNKEKDKYIPKVNLTLKNKIKQKILRAETINDNKNNNLKYILASKNIKRQKDIKDKIVNETVKYKFINRNKEIINNSTKLNHSNIEANNSFHKEKFNNIFKDKKNENICNTIDINKKYKNFIEPQRNTVLNSGKYKYFEDRYNSIDNSNIIKDNITLKNDFNENNSIFNQIISRFKKFNENYQKFIQHTTESNMFNNNIKQKINNKSTDITEYNNNQREALKLEKEQEKEEIKLIKVNHMKKIKKKKNKNNLASNQNLDKINNQKENRHKKILQKDSHNKKDNDIFSINNDYLLNKINNKRNFKNQLSKNKEKKIVHIKNNYSVNYNNNRTINYIPIDFKINSDKREFKKNKLIIKNKSPNNIEIIRFPIKIIPKYNRASQNDKEMNNKTFLLKNENIYNKINNNFITKKISFPKHNKITLDSSLDNDKKQYNENSFICNTNSSLNYNCYPKINTTSEFENSLTNINNPRQSPFTIKTTSYNLRIKERDALESLNLKEKEGYIKITDNQNNKESFENDNSFFYGNSNKAKKNINQKINLYIKPIKSKSKNKQCRNTFSKNKLLYKKKNNINCLTTIQINNLNHSIESRRKIKEINYIKKPIHKIINYKKIKDKEKYLEENKNKNRKNDINTKEENKKIIKEKEYINDENDESFNIIQKDYTFCRYKKYYNFYLTLPIKQFCYLQKIRRLKLIKQNNEISNNNINGSQISMNQRKNIILDFLKNGKDDIKVKNISNSYSKNISNFRNENSKGNELSLFPNDLKNSLGKEKQENSKMRSITQEKFAIGCSKLNKIFGKNSKINCLFNGLQIDLINSNANDSKKNEEKNNEINIINYNEKENGGVGDKYKINNSLNKNSEKHNKNKGFLYEVRDLLTNDENSEINESYNHLNETKNKGNKKNEILKNNKSEDYFYNVPQIKKPKNKKKSNSKRKINRLKSKEEKEEINKSIIFDKDAYEQISQDMENFLKFEENEKDKKEKKEIVDIDNVYNWKTIDKLMTEGKIKLEDIIKIYVEICKNKNFVKNDVENVIKYIKSIIEYYISDFSNNQIEIVHLNMIELFKSVFEISNNEIFSEIIGNLLFILLKCKFYYMKDLNYYIEKEKEIQINIAKIVRYCVLSSGKYIKQYHNDFKFTKLFNNNEIFINHVTNEIPELKNKI